MSTYFRLLISTELSVLEATQRISDLLNNDFAEITYFEKADVAALDGEFFNILVRHPKGVEPEHGINFKIGATITIDASHINSVFDSLGYFMINLCKETAWKFVFDFLDSIKVLSRIGEQILLYDFVFHNRGLWTPDHLKSIDFEYTLIEK